MAALFSVPAIAPARLLHLPIEALQLPPRFLRGALLFDLRLGPPRALVIDG